MDITVLRKEELLLLAAELGMDINSRLRKPEIRAAIEEVGFEEDELTDAWEKICRERNERAEEKEKQEKREQRQAEIELERIKLEQARLARSADAAPPPPAENTWPERLLALLPGEASQVVARLSAAEAGEYSSVKSSLLAKYRLSTEEFRRRFRQERKKSNESFVEFACSLRDNFSEWVKGTGADNFTKLGDLICLEQFYKTLPDNVRLWVKDRQEGVSVKRAAQLADEYVASRGLRTQVNSAHNYQKPSPRPQAYPRGQQTAAKRDDANQSSARSEGIVKAPERGSNKPANQSEELEARVQLRYDDNESVQSKDEVSSSESVVAQEEENPENLEDSRDKQGPVEKKKRKSKGKDDSFQGTVLAPTAPSYERLLGVDRKTLREAQKNDPTLGVLNSGSSEGVSSKNISFEVRKGVLYPPKGQQV
ncbi:hypothetical protein HPB50_014945 [Hyalomma asiaticum]|uniref:Uncharacterized protein n=1 Tax=Hyalomma asiaticum TaxID=266040 RepID=A0ACB7S1J4_HYAAI|nr:hypothetical protein HPB50_014945 [Hyalomma asiaticum]